MKKLMASGGFIILLLLIIPGCGSLTNTTGNLFSLNGTWTMTSTTDGSAMTGTTITVYPVLGNASIKNLSNNTYCVRESDQLWKSIKSADSGGFNISALVSACNGTIIYRDGLISVVNNDMVTMTSRTADNRELIQKWERVK